MGLMDILKGDGPYWNGDIDPLNLRNIGETGQAIYGQGKTDDEKVHTVRDVLREYEGRTFDYEDMTESERNSIVEFGERSRVARRNQKRQTGDESGDFGVENDFQKAVLFGGSVGGALLLWKVMNDGS